MNLLRQLKLAFNILVHSKVRSWLAIIGIVIGVASVIAIMSLGEGMQQQLDSTLGGLGADTLTISAGSERASGPGGGFRRPDDVERTSSSSSSGVKYKNLTNRDVQALKLVENVEYVNGIVSGRADMGYLSQTSSVNVQGVDTGVWRSMVTTKLGSGRYLNPGDKNVVVIGDKIADGLFKQNVQLNRQVLIEGVPFRVVGILEETQGFGFGGSSMDRAVIMPIGNARDVLEDVGDNEFDSIVIKVKDANLIEETEAGIIKKLMLVRAVTERTKDFSITSIKETQETISETLSTMTLFLGAIAAISLLVGAVGIANAMFTTVLQKTKEIGVMKSVGGKNRDIMMIFLFNSGMIGLAGGILGAIIGYFLSKGVPLLLGGVMLPGRMGGASTFVSFSLVFYVLVFSLSIGILAGIIPAYRASRMNPVDSLRYE